LQAANDAVELSYAPYSRFHVGAALLLSNGEIIKGSNQENASFPAGICAERVALSVASSMFPSEKITAVAISYRSGAESEFFRTTFYRLVGFAVRVYWKLPNASNTR
jgi:cytidine deaminase